VDAGFGMEKPCSLTLELFNASSNTIALKPDMRIVQMTVHELTEESPDHYADKVESKYNRQTDATPSRLYQDWSHSESENNGPILDGQQVSNGAKR